MSIEEREKKPTETDHSEVELIKHAKERLEKEREAGRAGIQEKAGQSANKPQERRIAAFDFEKEIVHSDQGVG